MPGRLYTSSELLADYRRGEPDSFTRTWDYKTYARYIAEGGGAPRTEAAAVRQATHDAEISQALSAYLEHVPKIVAVMGGHSLKRDSKAYQVIAGIARGLAQDGFLIATGGGPGAMEAGHVGAYFARADQATFDEALHVLATGAVALPRGLDTALDAQGHVKPGQEAVIAAAAAWLDTALRASDLLADPGVIGESLALPTWYYGSEPSTPFATAYAKYYQNSIREERLVAQGKAGTLYAQGEGGTLREIFQGVEENYYAPPGQFKPMIFVDPGGYWTTSASYDVGGKPATRAIDIHPTIEAVFKLASDTTRAALAEDKLLFTTDFAQIRDTLNGHAPAAAERLKLVLSGFPTNLLSSRR